MKRLILSVPDEINLDALYATSTRIEVIDGIQTSVEVKSELELSGTMAVKMPGSHEYNGRCLLDIRTPDDNFSPGLFGPDAIVLYDGGDTVGPDILNYIDGPVLPHSWAGITNPTIFSK